MTKNVQKTQNNQELLKLCSRQRYALAARLQWPRADQDKFKLNS